MQVGDVVPLCIPLPLPTCRSILALSAVEELRLRLHIDRPRNKDRTPMSKDLFPDSRRLVQHVPLLVAHGVEADPPPAQSILCLPSVSSRVWGDLWVSAMPELSMSAVSCSVDVPSQLDAGACEHALHHAMRVSCICRFAATHVPSNCLLAPLNRRQNAKAENRVSIVNNKYHLKCARLCMTLGHTQAALRKVLMRASRLSEMRWPISSMRTLSGKPSARQSWAETTRCERIRFTRKTTRTAR